MSTKSGTEYRRAPISLKALPKRLAKRRAYNKPPAPVSRKQRAHFDTLLKALDASQLAQDVDAALTANGVRRPYFLPAITIDPAHQLANRMRYCAAGDRRVRRCNHPQCVRCRRDHIGSRIDSALKAFAPYTERVFWTTVVVSAEPDLFEPLIQQNILDQSSIRLPTKAEITDKTKRTIADARRRIDSAVRSLAPTEFIAEGAFEIDVAAPATCGLHKGRLLGDMGVATGAAAAPTVPDLALLHVHFVCAVRRKNGFASRAEITRALRSKFPGRRRVFVKSLHRDLPVAANVRNLVGYSLKGFCDFRPERAVQVALVLQAVGRRGLGFTRRVGMGQRPTTGSADKADPQVGGDHHRPGTGRLPTPEADF